jgi:hypothetical protein
MKKSHPPNENSRENLAVARRAGNIRSYVIIKEIMGSRVVDSLPLRVRCECSNGGCHEIIELSLAKRRELRNTYRQGFIVITAHVDQISDSVFIEDHAFTVVGKPAYPDRISDL